MRRGGYRPGVATVAWLSIAPVKGMALVDVDSIELTPSGVEGNRRLYLVDEAGRFYAGIQNGRLVQIRAEMSDGRLALRFPDGSAVDDEIRLGDEVTTLFYGRPERGRVVVGPWADAVSHFAGRPLRLVRSEHPAGGVDRDQGPVTLAPGDHAIYSSTQAYAYVNAHHGVTRFIRNVVS